MKQLFILFTFLITTFSYAKTYDSLDFHVKKAKCTLFGNLKLKISGLENELGRTGIRSVKSNVKRKECKSLLRQLKNKINERRGTLVVDAQTNQTIIYTERYQNDLWENDYFGGSVPLPMSLECHKSKSTSLSFPLTLDSGRSLIFSAHREILLSVTFGPCPR